MVVSLWLAKQQLLCDLISFISDISHPVELICNIHPFNTCNLTIMHNFSPSHPFLPAEALPGMHGIFKPFVEVEEEFSSNTSHRVPQKIVHSHCFAEFSFGF